MKVDICNENGVI